METTASGDEQRIRILALARTGSPPWWIAARMGLPADDVRAILRSEPGLLRGLEVEAAFTGPAP